LTWNDLLQLPLFYEPNAFSCHPLLSQELAEVTNRSCHHHFEYRALMLEPAAEYGPGLIENGKNRGIGTSFDNPSLALTKSILEAFERKYSKVWNPDDLQVSTFNELRDSGAVSPEAFGLVTEWEMNYRPLPYVRYTPELPLAWTSGLRVRPGSTEPVLLPAVLVYARYGWKVPDERIAPTLSTGLAAHTTYRAAFLGGLCEIIERDAFMFAWLNRSAPPRIDPDSVDFNEAQDALAHIKALGFVPHFLNLTTDVSVPTIATILEHPTLPWEGTLVPGLGCNLDPAEALKKSFLEALTMLSNVVTYKECERHIEPIEYQHVHDIPRSVYYKAAHFLIDGSEEIAIEDIPNADCYDTGRNLELVLENLEQANMSAYFVDLTPPDAYPARLVLGRAMIAGMQPMLYETDCWRFVKSRLQHADFGSLNLYPNLLMATL
jgi:ribosomal protein S12 methylthiotransferase accessory factor